MTSEINFYFGNNLPFKETIIPKNIDIYKDNEGFYYVKAIMDKGFLKSEVADKIRNASSIENQLDISTLISLWLLFPDFYIKIPKIPLELKEYFGKKMVYVSLIEDGQNNEEIHFLI